MIPPNDPLWPHAVSEGPRDDHLFRGALELIVPPGKGMRCKAIRTVFRTTTRLFMGPGRGWEEDVIFERKTELIGGSDEGIELSVGAQR
jgi:hypothetical protein